MQPIIAAVPGVEPVATAPAESPERQDAAAESPFTALLAAALQLTSHPDPVMPPLLPGGNRGDGANGGDSAGSGAPGSIAALVPWLSASGVSASVADEGAAARAPDAVSGAHGVGAPFDAAGIVVTWTGPAVGAAAQAGASNGEASGAEAFGAEVFRRGADAPRAFLTRGAAGAGAANGGSVHSADGDALATHAAAAQAPAARWALREAAALGADVEVVDLTVEGAKPPQGTPASGTATGAPHDPASAAAIAARRVSAPEPGAEATPERGRRPPAFVGTETRPEAVYAAVAARTAAAEPVRAESAAAPNPSAAAAPTPPAPPAPVPTDRVTLQLPDEAGGARIQVAVRAGTVTARIVTPNAVAYRELEAGLRELHHALAQRGFDDVSVAALAPTRGSDEPRIGYGAATNGGDSGDARPRDQHHGHRRQPPDAFATPNGDPRQDQRGRPQQRSRRAQEG